MPHVTNIEVIFQNIRRKAPKIHCLTNPVTMQDVANLLLAAGVVQLLLQLNGQGFQIQLLQKLLDGLGAHGSLTMQKSKPVSMPEKKPIFSGIP